MKTLTNLLYNLLISLFIAAFASSFLLPAGALITGAIFFLSGFLVPSMKGTANDEVIRRIFSRELQEMLFPPNEFYTGAQVDEGIVHDADTVEIPQDENGEADYIVNPKKFPLEVTAEEDSKKSYKADHIATKPQLITNLNQALLSYDKRAAKLRKHANTLNTQASNRIANAWGTTKGDYIRQTTSATTRPATLTGTTGNRKRIAKADWIWAFSAMNDLSIPQEGRRVLIPTFMYEDLLYIDDFIDADKLRAQGNLAAGQIGSVLGFAIFMRPQTVVYTEAATPQKKAVGAAVAATDNQAAIFWHPSFVRYAKGAVRAHVDPVDGKWLGGTLNAELRSGGTIGRNSELGVLALVEDNA
jgi:hypothetical protein